MKINFFQDLIDVLRIEIENQKKEPFKLFYIGNSKYNNVGDMFNVTLMNYFGLRFIKARVSTANIFQIGSVLEFLFESKNNISKIKTKKCVILGSGFIEEPVKNEILIKQVEILALRGEYTKRILERMLNNKIDCLLADPGVMASYIFPYSANEKKYKVGIIPHYCDKNEKFLENIKLTKYSYCIIDVELSPKKLFKRINQCECIISSSLHGLIFADSYNIPNRQIIISDKITGGLFKFKDYYSAYDLNLPTPIDIRQNFIDDKLIDKIIKEYVFKNDKIKEQQKNLLNIYNNIKLIGLKEDKIL